LYNLKGGKAIRGFYLLALVHFTVKSNYYSAAGITGGYFIIGGR
jgi:hypothetical protein